MDGGIDSAYDALRGRNILVAGAACGIGSAIAQMAALAGATVISADVSYSEDANNAGPPKGQRYRLNVESPDDWNHFIETIIVKHRHIDGLVNAASVDQGFRDRTDRLLNHDPEHWHATLRTHLHGPYNGMRAVLPHMLEKGGGRIVNIASTCALIGVTGTLSTSAAHAGLVGMTRQAAVEYAAGGVRINSICAGVIDQGDAPIPSPRIPMQRAGVPDDVARMAVFLLGNGGEFITGQNFSVDGGWTAC